MENPTHLNLFLKQQFAKLSGSNRGNTMPCSPLLMIKILHYIGVRLGFFSDNYICIRGSIRFQHNNHLGPLQGENLAEKLNCKFLEKLIVVNKTQVLNKPNVFVPSIATHILTHKPPFLNL
ncbi:Hypothetical predicted protein [Podarcis lilfordi]|uniref:Uncharacterized protein n=1 Tax=Podarcis lilfordi TaxID=74358 RepID=A0AA35KTW3_9SAUR|nr:Hypothetical predicted protein [Podarcis lilfordi]